MPFAVCMRARAPFNPARSRRPARPRIQPQAVHGPEFFLHAAAGSSGVRGTAVWTGVAWSRGVCQGREREDAHRARAVHLAVGALKAEGIGVFIRSCRLRVVFCVSYMQEAASSKAKGHGTGNTNRLVIVQERVIDDRKPPPKTSPCPKFRNDSRILAAAPLAITPFALYPCAGLERVGNKHTEACFS